jgi:PhnB protein
MTVKPIPNEHQPMSPYLVVKGAPQAIAFYEKAFGAKEIFRLTMPDGKVGHAELLVGGARFMLADEHPDFGAIGPVTIGGTPVSLYLCDRRDKTVESAVSAGGTLLRPVKDEFYGDRVALLTDPFGHKWHLATHKEEVSPEEMQRRLDAAYE